MERSQIQVQGTNDSSIVSKLSMVQRGYFEDQFIFHFVEKPSRRSPLINRCYYARASAISYCMERFLSDVESDRPKQIISLGAGFDTSYFRMREKISAGFKFIEIDFPDVMRRKIALAEKASLLPEDNLSGFETERKLDMLIYKSAEYIALGYDLRFVGKRLTSLLASVGVDVETPTMFLSEVVLAYLPSEKSSSVLKWAAEEFLNAVFVVFEQVTPGDSFGKVMCKHFKQIGGPLLTIDAFPTIASHVDRHKYFGLIQSNATSLDRFYHHCIAEEERRRVERLEVFDEFEAWQRACQHYFILCSTNSSLGSVQMFCQELCPQCGIAEGFTPSVTDTTVSEPRKKGLIQRFGHCSCVIKQEFHSNSRPKHAAVFGGFGISSCRSNFSTTKHQRLTGDVAIVDLETLETFSCRVQNRTKDFLEFPMFGTAVFSARNSAAVIFGGRSSPMKATNSLTVVTFSSGDNAAPNANGWVCSYNVVTDVGEEKWPAKRWRHAAVMVSAEAGDFMVVFGGRDSSNAYGDCWCYNITNHSWAEVLLTGDVIEPRHSHSMCKVVSDDGNVVILSGGLNGADFPLGDVYRIQITHPLCTQATVERLRTASPMPPRYSHTSHTAGERLFLVGGVKLPVYSQFGDVGAGDSVDVFSLKTCAWICSHRLRQVDDAPLMLHNHCSVLLRHKPTGEKARGTTESDLVVVGGGDNCFSFGTWFNQCPFSAFL